MHGGSWSLSQQETFERAIFLPRWETVGAAATHWTEWEEFFWRKKPEWPSLCIIIIIIHDIMTHRTARMTKQWFTQCGWEVFKNSSHRWGLVPLNFNFIDLSKKSLAVELVSWLHSLNGWQISLGCTPMSHWSICLSKGGGYVEKWCTSPCMCKGKVKFTLEQAPKAQSGSTHRALLFP